MRAYVFTAIGGPDAEAFADLPVPEPGPGQILIAVQAAGVNPADWKQRAGMSARPARTLPAVFGREAAGVVVRTGTAVTGYRPGDAVFGYPDTGAFAEYTLLPAGLSVPRPPGLPATEAATLPVAAATAYDGLAQLGLPAGATLLVTGAGGGVGVVVAQLAVRAGITVIGTASAAKRAFVTALGVVHVPSGPGAAQRVRAAAPAGVDAIYDLAGGPGLAELAALLADRSMLITAADRQAAVRLGGRPLQRERSREVLEEVAQLAARGVFRPMVTGAFPLEEAGAALRAVEDGHATGKLVITVAAGGEPV